MISPQSESENLIPCDSHVEQNFFVDVEQHAVIDVTPSKDLAEDEQSVNVMKVFDERRLLTQALMKSQYSFFGIFSFPSLSFLKSGDTKDITDLQHDCEQNITVGYDNDVPCAEDDDIDRISV